MSTDTKCKVTLKVMTRARDTKGKMQTNVNIYIYKQKSYINKLVKDNQRNVEAISQGKDDHEDMSAQSDECEPVNNLNLWCKCLKNMDSVCVCIQALDI